MAFGRLRPTADRFSNLMVIEPDKMSCLIKPTI